jgi:hypothetical protein
MYVGQFKHIAVPATGKDLEAAVVDRRQPLLRPPQSEMLQPQSKDYAGGTGGSWLSGDALLAVRVLGQRASALCCEPVVSKCQWIGPKLEADDLWFGSLATFHMEWGAGTVGRPDPAALPAGIGVVDATVHPLDIEAKRIWHPQGDELAINQG